MTQAQVAERMEADVDTNWITQLELGRKKGLPEWTYLHGLSLALRVPVTEIHRAAGQMPEGMEAAPEMAAGSDVIHALVDMIDWSADPTNRQNVEGLLQFILAKQQEQ
jgi:transcriptional regulator with XRE-family HTH domain